MYIFTSVQTTLYSSIGNYPLKDVEEWNNSKRYGAFKDVAVYTHNGAPYNNVYTSLNENNLGDFPPSSPDSWVFKEKVSIYKPIQPTPTSHILKVGGFSYGVRMSNATHVLIMGVEAKTIKVEELNASNLLIAKHIITTHTGINKYLVELRRVIPTQKIRITVTPTNAGDNAGFTLVRGLVKHDLGSDTIKCQKCESSRVYVKKTSSYTDNGEKMEGTSQIVEDKKVSLVVSKNKKDELKNLLSEVVDTPIFLTKGLTNSDVNNGIYGYYSMFDLVEDCKNGNYSFSGTVQSYPYKPPHTLKDEILPPKINVDCNSTAQTAFNHKVVVGQLGEFIYNSPKIKIHHSTDWILKDSSGKIIDELHLQTGINKYLYNKRVSAGNYTLEAIVRDSGGNTSTKGTRTYSFTDSNNIYGNCLDIFKDGSMVDYISFHENSHTKKSYFSNALWEEQYAGNTRIISDGEGKFITLYRGRSYIRADNKVKVPYRFDLEHNPVISISFHGYFIDPTNYCFPFVIKWGSLIVAMCPRHTKDDPWKSGCQIWLESNEKRGNGSPMLETNFSPTYTMEQYAITANLLTRTVKFYCNGVLEAQFYNIPNTGTSHNFDDNYSMGYGWSTTSCGAHNYKGGIRSFAVFNKELTDEEVEELHRSLTL